LLITDRVRFDGEDFFTRVEAALAGGVDAILVREKQMDSARLLAFCARLREMTRTYGARLLVHTQADVAKAVDADGVHVAGEDIARVTAIRAWLDAPNISISASTHNAYELHAAATSDCAFALLSPVFPTTSHPGAPHLGVNAFRELAQQSPLPVVALGGINLENRTQLAGFPVAVISALLDVKDSEQIKKTAVGLRAG